jgi:hypothetical protein
MGRTSRSESMIRRPIVATAELCRPPVGRQPVPPMRISGHGLVRVRRCRLYDADMTPNNFTRNLISILTEPK